MELEAGIVDMGVQEVTALPDGAADVFARVVEARRSVRKFDGARVPEETVRECLRLAMLAPNSSNLQAWEFYWARTPEVKAAVAEACLGQQAARTAGELIAIVGRTRTWRRHAREVLEQWPGGKPPRIVRTYYEKLAPLMYTQGLFGEIGLLKRLVFAVVGLFRPMPREPMSPADMRVWAVKTTALAAENLILAFQAHGYDTCAMEGFDRVRVRRLLRIPRDGQILMVLAVGKAAPGGIYSEQFRLPAERFVFER